jgi:hypothetical protein
MRNLLLIITSIFFGINLGISQTNNVEIKLSDFEFNSPYYKDNFNIKTKIHSYLSELEITGKDIREILLNYCLNNGTIESENNKSKELKTKSDSIISALNSLGNIIYCITAINKKGDIFYKVTRSGNLSILINEGVLRRY